jgi:hypothetical protein
MTRGKYLQENPGDGKTVGQMPDVFMVVEVQENDFGMRGKIEEPAVGWVNIYRRSDGARFANPGTEKTNNSGTPWAGFQVKHVLRAAEEQEQEQEVEFV